MAVGVFAKKNTPSLRPGDGLGVKPKEGGSSLSQVHLGPPSGALSDHRFETAFEEMKMAPSSLNIRRTLYRIHPDWCDRDCDGVGPPGWKAYWLSATSDWLGHPRNSSMMVVGTVFYLLVFTCYSLLNLYLRSGAWGRRDFSVKAQGRMWDCTARKGER